MDEAGGGSYELRLQSIEDPSQPRKLVKFLTDRSKAIYDNRPSTITGRLR